MSRVWICDFCTFQNKGDGFCTMCGRGQPPPLAGEWRCKSCTLVNSESSKNCVVCEHPRPKKPKAVSPKELARQVDSRNAKKGHRGSPADRAKITIVPKSPPPAYEKPVEFIIKPVSNHAKRPKNYDDSKVDYNKKPMQIFQEHRGHNLKAPIKYGNFNDNKQKPVKSFDIDLELPTKKVAVPLFRIEPKGYKPAKKSVALPPYSMPLPPFRQEDYSSDEEYKIKSRNSRNSWNERSNKPREHRVQQKPVPILSQKNYGDVRDLEDDVKRGEIRPYHRGPQNQLSLSEAIAEDSKVGKGPGPVDDSGTEALIRKLMQQEMCQRCNERQGIEISGCWHKVCKLCGKESIEKGIRTKKWASQAVTCPIKGCKIILPQCVFRHFDLSRFMIQELEKMQQKFNVSQAEDLVRCPSKECGYTFVGEPGKVVRDKVEVGRDGKALTEAALSHKAKHRFRCPECRINFCGECSVTPYHVGDTCKTYQQWRESKKCRFCEATIDLRKIPHKPDWQFPGWDNVCHLEECQERRHHSCGKVHECGHPCIGIRNEKQCLPCFHPDCVPKGSETWDEWCTICYTEVWSAAPCVQLECGHVAHYHCVLQQLEKRWPAARIVFSYLNCPKCKRPIRNENLTRKLHRHEKLKRKVVNMALDQLKREGFDEDERLSKKGGKYYNNKELFAMDRLAYYICFKCQKPYYGGMRKCDAQDINKFNKEHLVCGGCRMGSNKKSCKIHGTEFIVWKCKFCCSRGSWFCWGNTHFCDKCHKRQEGGDYLNRKPMSAHPKCPGIESGNPLDCPLKVKHPPNGNNFCLGCNVCLIS